MHGEEISHRIEDYINLKYFPKFILHDPRLKGSPQHRRID